ncbi:MAG: helix-turn-helix transcriptional regulator [Candidatus Korobacteraceae bacterium]
MTGDILKKARFESGLTQQQAAVRLGVSQPYLALLEGGKRSLTVELARKAVRKLNARPTIIPCAQRFRARCVPTDSLVKQLRALGYPGYSYMRAGWTRNPAEVLLAALQQDELDPRVAEALPWVLLNYPDLDRDWLLKEARASNSTNRLGFLVSLAMLVAEQRGNKNSAVYQSLARFEDVLKQSRLESEYAFGNPVFSAAQQEWVRQNRPGNAEEWHVLTTLRPEHLQYA